MEINIQPKDVDRMVKDSILKSMVGAAINESVSKCFGGYDSPIEREVKKYVGEIVSQLLREKFSAQIKKLVEGFIKERVTNELLQKVTDTCVDRMIKGAWDNVRSNTQRLAFSEGWKYSRYTQGQPVSK